MEALFTAMCSKGKLVFYNTYDLERFCLENDGTEMIITIKESSKLSQKLKMYAFYHVAILDCAVRAYTNAGYPGIDKVKADYLLRAEFAKDFIEKPNGEFVPIMIDKRNMSKGRLHKFLSDCLFFLESEFSQEVPNAEEFKLKKATGRNYKEAK